MRYYIGALFILLVGCISKEKKIRERIIAIDSLTSEYLRTANSNVESAAKIRSHGFADQANRNMEFADSLIKAAYVLGKERDSLYEELKKLK
ncbi:MAG: hypothetical protein V4615_06990 [Bacteroidota bacterium]